MDSRTAEACFPEYTGYYRWIRRNCETCGMAPQKPLEARKAARCAVLRGIYRQQMGAMEIRARSYRAARQTYCPYWKGKDWRD